MKTMELKLMENVIDMSNLVISVGLVNSSNFIKVPDEWKDVVDPQSISVSLTPIGAHQDVIVKRVDINEVLLQSRPGIPIRCYYQIFGQVKEGYSAKEVE